MARTRRDEGVNADPAGQNMSVAPKLGAAQQSSNAWMGISSRVEDGTPGSRPNLSHGKYGGDREEGELFKGTSANMPSNVLKEVNAQDSGEQNSWNSKGQYGPGSPNYLAGGFGAREQMTIGGDENRGAYVGDGVNATPDTLINQYFTTGEMKTQMPQNQFLAGTDEARGTGVTGGNNSSKESGGDTNNMLRAHKGIGKRYPRGDAKNQVD